MVLTARIAVVRQAPEGGGWSMCALRGHGGCDAWQVGVAYVRYQCRRCDTGDTVPRPPTLRRRESSAQSSSLFRSVFRLRFVLVGQTDGAGERSGGAKAVGGTYWAVPSPFSERKKSICP